MNNIIDHFALGVLALCALIMRAVGVVDSELSRAMIAAGINSQRQTIVLFVVILVLMVAAIRVLRGYLGWVVFILLLLLLMHRIVPQAVIPNIIPADPLHQGS